MYVLLVFHWIEQVNKAKIKYKFLKFIVFLGKFWCKVKHLAICSKLSGWH